MPKNIFNRTSEGDVSQDSVNDVIQQAITAGSGNSLFDTLQSISSQDLSSGLTYKGVWNATDNIPSLGSVYVSTSPGNGSGDYFIVNVAGSTNINGISDWSIGDWIIRDDSTWRKIDHTNQVSSVNSRVGAVSLNKADVGLSAVDNTTDLNKPISSLTQTALNGKEPTITAGTTAHYWRGDKSWATIPSVNTITQGDSNVTVSDSGTNGVISASPDGFLKMSITKDETRFHGTNSIVAYGSDTLTVGNGNFHISNGNFTITNGDIIKNGNPLLNDILASTDNVWTGSKVFNELALKEPVITAGLASQFWRGDKTFQTLDKTAVGLPLVDNTADINKPISALTQTALNLKANTIHTHTISDITNLQASLDAKESQLPYSLTQQTISGLSYWVPSVVSTGYAVANNPLWTFSKPRFTGNYMFIIGASGYNGNVTANIKTIALSYDISVLPPVKLCEVLVSNSTGYIGFGKPIMKGQWLVGSQINGTAFAVNCTNPNSLVVQTFSSNRYGSADMRGRYLYAHRGLYIDVFDLYSPSSAFKTTITLTIETGLIKIVGNYLYAFSNLNGNQTVNLNVYPPVVNPSLWGLPNGAHLGVSCCEVSGNYLYVGLINPYDTTGWPAPGGGRISRFSIFANNQANPVLDTSFGVNGLYKYADGTSPNNDQADDIEVSGNLIYITGRSSYHIFVYDVNNFPATFSSSGYLAKSTQPWNDTVAVGGKYVFGATQPGFSSSIAGFFIYLVPSKIYNSAVIGDIKSTNINSNLLTVSDNCNLNGSCQIAGSLRVDDEVILNGNVRMTGLVECSNLKTGTTGIDLTDPLVSFKVAGTEHLNLSSSGAAVNSNLTVGGNLTVHGSNIILNTQTITVDDPIIRLADNNVADILDCGFYTVQNTNKYSGLIRKASDKIWYLTNLHTTEPVANTNYASSPGDLSVRKLLWGELNMNFPYQGIYGSIGTPMLLLNSADGSDGAQNIEIRHHLYITDPVFPNQILSMGRGSGSDTNNFTINRDSVANNTSVSNGGVNMMSFNSNSSMTLGAQVNSPFYVFSKQFLYHLTTNSNTGLSGGGLVINWTNNPYTVNTITTGLEYNMLPSSTSFNNLINASEMTVNSNFATVNNGAGNTGTGWNFNSALFNRRFNAKFNITYSLNDNKVLFFIPRYAGFQVHSSGVVTQNGMNNLSIDFPFAVVNSTDTLALYVNCNANNKILTITNFTLTITEV